MRVLEAREIGHGILVEHDGHLSPEDNKGILSEMAKDNFDGVIEPSVYVSKVTGLELSIPEKVKPDKGAVVNVIVEALAV